MAAQDKPLDNTRIRTAYIDGLNESDHFLLIAGVMKELTNTPLRLKKYICVPNPDGISATVVCTYEKV